MNAQIEQKLLAKLNSLPPERVAEVEDFIDRSLVHAAARISEPAFHSAWDNDSDAAYDRI
jgi:hypothetical protein